jgi:hypothetical protein
MIQKAHWLAGSCLSLALILGCGSAEKRTTGGTGGEEEEAGSGGSVATGGKSGTGGKTGTGGSPGTGGSTATGGSPATGGAGGMVDSPDGGPATGGMSGGAGGEGGKGEVGPAGFAGWKYTKSIKMDTTAAGAGVMGNVANYPVAVVLNATNFDFTQAKADGGDVRFGKSDGTPIPYAKESFDAAGKIAAYWVLIDSVKGNDAAQSFNMYWGKADAGDASDSKKVFPAANGFMGVWHLAEDGATTAGAFKDASESGLNGTGVNLAAGALVPATIGKGIKMLNAMRQWVKVDDEMMKFRPTNMTVSIWGWADGFPAKWGGGGSPGYQTIYSSGEAWTIQRETNAKFESCINQQCAIGAGMMTKQWVHFVLTRNGGSQTLYMNGARVAGGGAANRADNKPLGIGQQTQYLDPVRHVNEQRSWEGILDEARVMNVVTSGDWIKLETQSQKPDSKFLIHGMATTR